MENIFIIGSSGFLGNYIINEFYKKYTIFAHINKNFPKDKKKVNFVKFKLTQTDKLKAFLEKKSITKIIYLASITDVEECQKNKQKIKNLHVNIIKNIIKLIKNKSISIIFISTDQLFDGKTKSEYSERSKKNPLNYYGLTKSLAENELTKLKNTLVIRCNFFGKNFSVSRPSFSDKLINYLNKNKKIELWCDVFFSPMHVINLAYVIRFLCDRGHSGIYNISSSKISKYDLACKIAKKLSLNSSLIKKNNFDVKKFSNRGKNCTLSNKKILKKYPQLKKKLSLNAQINLLK